MRRLIIFSLDQNEKPASDADMDVVKHMIFNCGLVSRPALGIYKGKAERSFMVEVQEDQQADLIKAIARAFDQECIMSIDLKTFDASLEYLLPNFLVRKEVIGHWCKTDTINKDNMTLDLNSMTGYVVK